MPTGRCNCVRSPARKDIERRGRRKEESGEKKKVRNKESVRLNRNLFKLCSRNFLLLTVTLLTVPTRQREASLEVQVLHARGKMPLRKVTCEKEDSATRQEKGRKGERRR